MAILAIDRKQFDGFKPERGPLVEMIAEERSWFRDTAGNVIGTVLLDKSDKDFNWVMLAKDPQGRFRAINTGVSIDDQAGAESALKKAMEDIEASGQTVFEQD